MVPSKRYPAFIKPFYPPNNRKSLKLPPPFTSFVKEIWPIKAVVLLKDHYDGKFWAVEVAKIGSDFFFQAGWTKFLEDNFLEFGDFLAFQYNGGDEFIFKILRATGDGRDIVDAMDFSSNQEEEEAVQVETGNDKKYMSEGEEDVIEVLEEEILVKNLGKRKGRSFGARIGKLGKSNYPRLNTEFQGRLNAVKNNDQDFKSNANALQSPFHGLQNPYFLVKYRKYKSNQVYVPQDFVKAFRAQLLPEIIIRDPSGKQWPMRFSIRRGQTMWMRGGWRLLAQYNNVKDEDCLACELVPKRDPQGSYIQLHIYRIT